MGGAVSTGDDNDDLIDNLLHADYIKTPAVERAFRAVDRADYYTDDHKDIAYKDVAWKDGNLHLSAPCIYSEVMESLKLEPNLSFLNLGSGTGYLATMVGLILGPYGLNHGIELHSDVVDYANKKLAEFRKNSAALDECEFCEPKFIVGNCLLLGSECRMYDRVYCGAACPAEHENYMKNLIKVGGILVMPLNEELLQITRTTETTWDMKSVMPVSFATLVPPSPCESLNTIILPDSNPLTLQEICRSAIRKILRHNVEFENPTFKVKRHPRPKRRNKHRCIRRIVIPIFEESDNEGMSSSGGGSGREGSESESGEERATAGGTTTTAATTNNSNTQQARRQFSAMIEQVFGQNDLVRDLMEAPNCFGFPRGDDTDHRMMETDDGESVEDNGQSLTTKDPPMNGQSKNQNAKEGEIKNIEMEDEEDDEEEEEEDKIVPELKGGKRNKSVHNNNNNNNNNQEPAVSSNNNNHRHTTAVVFSKRITYVEQDSDSEKEDVEVPPRTEPKRESYSTRMQEKIQSLPLPLALMAYLNYYRDFM